MRGKNNQPLQGHIKNASLCILTPSSCRLRLTYNVFRLPAGVNVHKRRLKQEAKGDPILPAGQQAAPRPIHALNSEVKRRGWSPETAAATSQYVASCKNEQAAAAARLTRGWILAFGGQLNARQWPAQIPTNPSLQRFPLSVPSVPAATTAPALSSTTTTTHPEPRQEGSAVRVGK